MASPEFGYSFKERNKEDNRHYYASYYDAIMENSPVVVKKTKNKVLLLKRNEECQQ